MFTGIVEELGKVREASSNRLVIETKILGKLAKGESIAVNGACLTVTASTADTFTVDLVRETVDRTNLGGLQAGDPVDLERALTPESRMGGHFVQGHVDGVGTVVEIGGPADDCTLRVDAPADIARYIVEKGFVAVDGISLTVTGVRDTAFSAAVIPYTMEHTVLGSRRPGDRVNLEADILAKYVERLLPQR